MTERYKLIWDFLRHVATKIGVTEENIYLSDYVDKKISQDFNQDSLKVSSTYYPHFPLIGIVLVTLFLIGLTEVLLDNYVIQVMSRLQIGQLLGLGEMLGIILRSQLQANLGMVGVIIPLVVLTLNAIGEHTSPSLVPTLKEKIGILQTISFGILTVFFQLTGVILLRLKLGLINPEAWRLRLLFFSALFTMLNFFLVARFLYYALDKSFDQSWIYTQIRNRLTDLMRKDVIKELKKRVSRNLFREKCKEVELYDWSGSYSNISSGVPIEARKLGKIKDINLKQLSRFAKSVSGQVGDSNKAYICKGPFEIVEDFTDVIGIVPYDNKDQIDTLSRKLQVALKIGSESVEASDYEEVLSKTKLTKDLVIKSIKNSAISQFEERINIYSNIINEYIDFALEAEVHFLPGSVSGPFSKWRALSQIENNLREIGRETVTLDNTEYARYLLYVLSQKLRESIKKDNYLICDLILSVYRTMFYRSFEYDNEVTIGRIRYHLTSTVDSYIKRELEKHNTDKAIRLKGFWEMIIDYRMKMLKDSIDNKHFDTFKELERETYEINPDFNYMSKWGTRHNEIEEKLDEGKVEGDEHDELIKELDSLKDLINPNTRWLEPLKHRILLEAGGYIINEIQNSRSYEVYQEYLSRIVSRFDKPEKLLNTFEKTIKDETTSLKWIIWEEFKESRQAQTSAPHRHVYLFYCIAGIILTSDGVNWPKKESEVMFHNFRSVKSTTKKVLDNKEKWIGIIPDLDDHLVAKFIDYNFELKKYTEEVQEQKIIQNKLSENRIKDFRQKARENYSESIPLQLILHELGTEVTKEKSNGEVHQKMETKIGGVLKRYFIEPEGILAQTSFTQTLHYVSAFADKEKKRLLDFLVDNAKEKNLSQDHFNALEQAFRKLKNFGQDPEIIFTSNNALSIEFMTKIKDDETNMVEKDENREDKLDPVGFFQGTPVVTFTSMPEESFLVANFSDTTRLLNSSGSSYKKTNALDIDVENYDKKEIQDILSRDESLTTEDIKKGVKIKLSSNFRIKIEKRGGFIFLQ